MDEFKAAMLRYMEDPDNSSLLEAVIVTIMEWQKVDHTTAMRLLHTGLSK